MKNVILLSQNIVLSPVLVGVCLLLWSPISGGLENFQCPQLLSKIKDESCEMIKCGNPVTQDDCPAKSMYIENFSFCQCCPSCVRYRHPDEECVPKDSPGVEWTVDTDCENGVCVVNENTCLPGLNCENSKCVLPSRGYIHNRETEECMFRKSLRQINSALTHWNPDCEADGSFSPKQCKGSVFDGECFCVDREGNRIFGREWRIKAENQTCECSRKTHALRQQGLIATFHCSEDGNFEPLQCDTDSGLCYCVDPQTGKLDGAVLPESQWKLLPCFSLNVTNNARDGKYLRKCESEYAGYRQLKIHASEHGFEMGAKTVNCDFDGSFAEVMYDNTRTQCVFKNGTRIGDNSMPDSGTMTCHCARDKFEYLLSQERSFPYGCEDRTGNYEIVYDFGSNSSCVDIDGYLYGDVARSELFCCLLGSGCSPLLQNYCYETYNGTINPGGVRNCTYWWFNN